MAYSVQVGSVTLGMDVLLDVQVHLAHSMVGETLESDTITVTYREKDPDPPVGFVVFPSTDEMYSGWYPMCDANMDEFWVQTPRTFTGLSPKALTSNTVMNCYSNDTLVGRFYFDSYKQTGKNKYTLYGVSTIGRLASQKHYGGLYTNATIESVVADILSGYSYTIDSTIASNTITGYLPIASKRDNLQQVLFAVGASVTTTNEGVLQIASMSSVVTSTLSKDKCFMDGNVQLSDPVTGVQLTEHNYFKAYEEVTLFEDGIYGTETIEFSEPYHSLSITGATITNSGANFATISGNGSVKLIGKKYIHVTRVVTAANSKSGNIKSVNNAYLANPAVAQSLADRVFAYLRNNVVISQDVMFTQERAGDVVKVINPYTGQLEQACTKELDITLSTLQRASGKFVVGYTPQGATSGYKNYVLLTDSGTWKVPTGVSKIRLILCGGGSGGGGGADGTAGSDGYVNSQILPSETYGGDGGQGGSAGALGVGGKIFEISLDVTAGTSYSYACGAGGAGGSANGGKGKAGGATTFGQLSSANGRVYADGYREVKTGLTFGQSGVAGHAGGSGGKGSDRAREGYYGEKGTDVLSYKGGKGANGYDYYYGNDDRNYQHYGGGGGGGAANGSNGSDGTNRGIGGNGANGSSGESGVNYGQGGGAGNGGGGGGGGSWRYSGSSIGTGNYDQHYACAGGTGGLGGAGGTGKQGCIVIYY